MPGCTKCRGVPNVRVYQMSGCTKCQGVRNVRVYEMSGCTKCPGVPNVRGYKNVWGYEMSGGMKCLRSRPLSTHQSTVPFVLNSFRQWEGNIWWKREHLLVHRKNRTMLFTRCNIFVPILFTLVNIVVRRCKKEKKQTRFMLLHNTTATRPSIMV